MPGDLSKGSRRKRDIHFDESKGNFTGEDVQALKQKLREMYFDEFGRTWLNATWASLCEWVGARLLETDGVTLKLQGARGVITWKDQWQAILGWFNRDAKEDRKKRT